MYTGRNAFGRPHGNERQWVNRLSRLKLDIETPEHLRQHELHFHHSKVVADTKTRSSSERKIAERGLLFTPFLAKAIGVETLRIFPMVF